MCYNTTQGEMIMKNNVGWTSEYRRKKFEKRYKKDTEFKPLTPITEVTTELNSPKTIAVMLDVEGTCDNIDDEKAKAFMMSIDAIRNKFGAKYGTISLSTHSNNSREMKRILTILSRNLSKDIEIGINFFFGGTYDFESDREIMMEPNFNRNKVSTFMCHYINTLGIQMPGMYLSTIT